MYGLTFNNQHSFRDYGLYMRSKNRPILPEPKIVTEDIPGMDGDYDYSEANPDGRTKYNSVTHDIEFGLIEKDPAILRIKAHDIARWLMCGEKQLIYDDEMAVFYLARVVNKLDLETQIIQLKQFTVQFKCRPFARSVVKSNEQIQFGQGLMLGYGYRLDMTPAIFSVSAPTAVNIYVPGDFGKPLIRITGSFSNISFTANGKTITYNAPVSNSTIEIDCEHAFAVQNGANVNNNTSGDYIEFVYGDNLLQISGTGLNCTVTFEFRYLYK